MNEISVLWLGIIASTLAGLATGLGALPIFFTRSISERLSNALLGFGAGVMLAATSFSLLLPGIEAARSAGAANAGAAAIMVAGMLLGAALLRVADSVVPHEHFVIGVEGGDPEKLKRIWLFVIAITLHNFPEGLAVGVGFGGGDIEQGTVLAIGIGLQNIPEGLAVALALVGERYTTTTAFLVALATGLVEPLGGLVGAGVVVLAQPLLPWGMAFAAGAMLYVISGEIIPESHSGGHQKDATAGVMIGFVIMLFLDVTLG